MNQQSVRTLKGIGEKTAKLFEKLDLYTLEDLLHYYPRSYDTYEAPVMIGQLKPDCVMAAEGSLLRAPDVKQWNHLQVITASLKDMTGVLQLTWFNMLFLRVTLKAGMHLIVRGRIVKKHDTLTMEQPEIFLPSAYGIIAHSMQPIYSQTKGLSNKIITKALTQVLEVRQMEKDYLPCVIRTKNQLAEYNFSLEHIHFPKDKQDLLFARKRLVFDEFFLFILSIRQLKEKRADKQSDYKLHLCQKVDEIQKKLPYVLTVAQKKVLREVYVDLTGGFVMNRLIQGDVGSGKTIIAVLALLQVAGNGYQGAFMAPTEVLAKQHYESMTTLFEQYGIEAVSILLTGSMTAKEKQTAYAKIAAHEADIIIGTHALIQEQVIYENLALVITDEQHRFGVGQREALGNKGKLPHVLVMSATPIPRTLAIIVYGDLDISVLDELPANRLPIKNCVVTPSYRKNAYALIAKEAAHQRQTYVVCPMVEASDMIEGENVIDYTKQLREALPCAICVEYLHGKMKSKEKNRIMERFAANEIQVLVSTTVIEVGVNVPNATVMMIENAERFGLAQLHQLRGRVGRGKQQSYCIMVNGSEHDAVNDRLDILNQSNDGFYIASEDLKLRGPGDIFGIRQSGDLEFKLADIFTDADILKTVSEEVDALLARDPDLLLPEQEELRKRLDSYLEKSYERLNL